MQAVEQLLSALGDSADKLQGELDVLGTSADEQEVEYFGDDEDNSSTISVGVLFGLTGGQRYTLSLSFANGAQPLPLDGQRTFPFTPIADRGDAGLQRTVTADFTAPITRNPFQIFVFHRPAGAPDTFNLSQVNLAQASVPEPATWAMMIGGLGVVGLSIRRQRAGVRERTA